MKYRALAVVVVIGVVACQGDRSYSAGPSALILDGAHGGGSAFFLWLPPVMPKQLPAGQVFSRQLSPTITIINLCSVGVIRSFGRAEELPVDGQYQASLITADS